MKMIRYFLILTVAIFGLSQFNVQAQSFSGGNQRADQAIEKQVFKKLIGMPYYGVFDNISYKVVDGTVTLYGKVYNAPAKGSAETIVRKISGVENVVNNIEILPLSRFDDSIRIRTLNILADRGGLYRYLNGNNPSMKIIVEDGNISLEGVVNSKGDARLANLLANQITGTFSVTNNLQIADKGAL